MRFWGNYRGWGIDTMATCSSCGANVADNARFCKACGKPITGAGAAGSQEARLRELAQKMRELSDEMITSYVNGLQDMGAAAQAAAGEISSLKARLAAREKELSAARENIAELRKQCENLRAENVRLRSAPGPAPSSGTATCPRCGAKVTSDMTFCEECGARLKAGEPR